MFLREVDFPINFILCTSQAYAALYRTQHTVVPLTGVAALEFSKQGAGTESGIGLQWLDDFAIPDGTQWVLSDARVSCGTLGWQALSSFNTPGASLADAT